MTKRQLYERCPDCNGMGSVSVMDGQGRETELQCERCYRGGGYVPVEVPKMVECRNPECRALIEVEIVGVGEETP